MPGAWNLVRNFLLFLGEMLSTAQKMWYDSGMKQRISYYVSRKNFFLWLAAAALVCSAVVRIAYVCGKGADAATVWFQIVLPVAASLIYALILLCSGEERLYRTAVPVFMLALYFGIRISGMEGMWLRYILLCWIAYMAFALTYAVIISGHRGLWMLPLMHLAALGVLLYDSRAALHAENIGVFYANLPDLLVLFAGLLVSCITKIHLDSAYHPTWGDRPDGRKLRTLDPVQVVGNYIMPTRGGSSNSIRETVEITAIERYIREKRRSGMPNFGITHVFLAAYVRCVAKYPALNRFLSGQQVYTRDGDIQFCMMIKEDMTTEAAESALKLHLKPTDTVEDIYRKFNEEVERIKSADDASDFDKTAKALSLIPGVVFKFAVWVLKTMDYFGLLPKFLLEVSPFHGSIFFTSMGSLGIPPIVHHLYDFGNLPVFVAFGCKYRKNEVQLDGTVVQRKYIDYTVNTDERICDGFYFATVLKHMKKLLSHPERLDDPVEEVVHDIE